MKNIRIALLLISISHLIVSAYKKTKKDMKNWKTTVFGCGATICAALVSSKCIPSDTWNTIIIALGTIFGSLTAYFAQDGVPNIVKSVIIVAILSLTANANAQTNNSGYPAQQTGGFLATPYVSYNNIAYPLAKTVATDTLYNGKANVRNQFIIIPNYTDTNKLVIIVNRGKVD